MLQGSEKCVDTDSETVKIIRVPAAILSAVFFFSSAALCFASASSSFLATSAAVDMEELMVVSYQRLLIAYYQFVLQCRIGYHLINSYYSVPLVIVYYRFL